jgi:hypothetical protein
LKESFIALSAKHKNNFTHFEVAQHVFANLREPVLRAGQAAMVWGKDLAVAEAIRLRILYGDTNADTAVDRLRAIALEIAEDPKQLAKDRIAALTYISSTQGDIVKAIEKTVTYPNGVKPGVSGFIFKIDRDAGTPSLATDDAGDAPE